MKTNPVFHMIVAFLLTTSACALAQQKPNIVEVAAADGSFKNLVAALSACHLDRRLSKGRAFTVFAPTDKAFAALPEELLEALLKQRNKRLLGDILANHIIEGKVPSEKALQLKEFQAYNGRNVDVDVKAGRLTLHGATVIQKDIVAGNGIIHVVDKLILPANLRDLKSIQKRLIGENDPQPGFLGRYIQPFAYNDLEKVESPMLKRYMAGASPDGRFATESFAFSNVGAAYRAGFSLHLRLNLTEEQNDQLAKYLLGRYDVSDWHKMTDFRRDWGVENLTKSQLDFYDEYVKELLVREKRSKSVVESLKASWGKYPIYDLKEIKAEDLDRYLAANKKQLVLSRVEYLAKILPLTETEYDTALTVFEEVYDERTLADRLNSAQHERLSAKLARTTILKEWQILKKIVSDQKHDQFVEYYTGMVERGRLFNTLDR